MATKASETTETTENREESRDRPLIDANSAANKQGSRVGLMAAS